MGITAINGIPISASAADSIGINNTPTGVGPYYLVFVDATSGYSLPRIDGSTLTYNSTTNTLTTSTFVGSLTGTSSWASNAINAVTASSMTIGLGSTNSTHYLTFGVNYPGGGPVNNVLLEEAQLTYNPSTKEFRGGLVNNTSVGSQASTADANLTIDAATTQSMTWIASLTTTRSLIINNLTDGRQVNVYIRNTNATQRQISFSGSTTTTGQVAINMSAGAGAASIQTQNIAGTSGTMYVIIRNIGGTFSGGIM